MSISSKNSRYFDNNLEDYVRGPANIGAHTIKQQIRSTLEEILAQQPANYRNCRGGMCSDLYVGDGGIAYMLYYIISRDLFPEMKEHLLIQALQYVDSSINHIKKKRNEGDTAFLLGSSGVQAVSAAVYGLLEDHKSSSREYLLKFADAVPAVINNNEWDEVLVGRAGYLSGVFWINKEMGLTVVSEANIHKICDALISSGRKYAKLHNSPCPLMYAYHGTEYLGAAHGLSTILQMLLTAPDYLQRNKEAMEEVKQSVDYLLSLQTSDGNFPCSLQDVGENARHREKELVHWCHGGPGVIYLMAKAFLVWNEQKYLDSCLLTGELVWNKGLLRKGPGICHGVAGSGYVFLLLYRLTSDVKYIHRAYKMAEFMRSEHFLAKARVPDRPYSLYEGKAGTVCFLADLLKADEAAFPFLDVF